MKAQLIITFVLATFPLVRTVAQSLLPPQISVSGSAEVKVAPDEIHLSVGVETRDEALLTAKRENDEWIAKALAFIKTNGVPEKDVKTDFISIEPVYENNVSRIKPTHYIVRKSIELRFTKIQGFESFMTGLLTKGITTVHGIDFRTTQLRNHRDRARAMALRAAQEKADEMAKELKVKRGKVYSVNANDWSGWSGGNWGGWGGLMYQNSVQNVGGTPEVSDTTLSVGQISVTASVNVTFLIE